MARASNLLERLADGLVFPQIVTTLLYSRTSRSRRYRSLPHAARFAGAARTVHPRALYKMIVTTFIASVQSILLYLQKNAEKAESTLYSLHFLKPHEALS
jgi:hypothetical protein